MAQSELDMRKILILFQRRYNAICGVSRLTNELADALARNDEVSVTMVLGMRADEMARFDDCTEEVWRMCKHGSCETVQKIRRLITSKPDRDTGESPEEEKIYEIRRKTQTVIDQLRLTDERLNRKVTGEKSYYGAVAR